MAAREAATWTALPLRTKAVASGERDADDVPVVAMAQAGVARAAAAHAHPVHPKRSAECAILTLAAGVASKVNVLPMTCDGEEGSAPAAVGARALEGVVRAAAVAKVAKRTPPHGTTQRGQTASLNGDWACLGAKGEQLGGLGRTIVGTLLCAELCLLVCLTLFGVLWVAGMNMNRMTFPPKHFKPLWPNNNADLSE